MQGFENGQPVSVAVTWLKNTDGSFVEVPLLDGQDLPNGLLAYTDDGAGHITRWFVPWSSVVYVKQVQVTQTPGAPATPLPTKPVPPTDG